MVRLGYFGFSYFRCLFKNTDHLFDKTDIKIQNFEGAKGWSEPMIDAWYDFGMPQTHVPHDSFIWPNIENLFQRVIELSAQYPREYVIFMGAVTPWYTHTAVRAVRVLVATLTKIWSEPECS